MRFAGSVLSVFFPEKMIHRFSRGTVETCVLDFFALLGWVAALCG